MAKLRTSPLLILCLLLLNLSSVLMQSNDKELILVHIMYLHGDHSPISTFPSDAYQESYWPQGFGQLTQLGMTQHYQLGQYFRSRYIEGVPYHLVKSTYNRHQVYVRSTNINRTLQSAYSNLAGMFPSSKSEMGNAVFPWQPIAVRSVDLDDDFLRIEACPKGFRNFRQEASAGERAQRIKAENSELFAFVAEKTGWSSLTDIGVVGDALNSEVCHGLPQPEWVERLWSDGQRVLDKILELHNINFMLGNSAPGVARLLGGGLLNDIVARMEKKVDGTSEEEDLKLQVYSAHDTTVAALMAAMNVFNNVKPPYASSIMIELFNISGQFAVELWYKNDTKREPYQLTIPGCNSTCPLNQFVELLKDNIVADWQTQCKLETTSSSSSSDFSLQFIQVTVINNAISCLVVVTVALLIIIVALLHTRRQTKGYQPIDSFVTS